MKPGSPEWQRLVTASKVAAILGLSPWESPRTMWLKMRGELGDDGNNADAKARGHYLERGVIDWWCDQHPGFLWLREQERLPLGDWGAATPDGIGVDEYGNAFVLDAAAPAIAARALREFADWAEESDFAEYPFDGLDDTVKTIRARADEIEATR